jgi:hypothetical protein
MGKALSFLVISIAMLLVWLLDADGSRACNRESELITAKTAPCTRSP